MSGKGLDIGTNMLVAASLEGGKVPQFKMQRDAFFVIKPKTEVNKNTIRQVLDKRKASYIASDNDFIVVGEDALEIAMERNSSASRPLKSGVISPKDKDNLPILKTIIKSLVGKGDVGNVPIAGEGKLWPRMLTGGVADCPVQLNSIA